MAEPVRLLVDADLPRGVAPLARSRGYESADVRDIGLGGATDSDIAAFARREKYAILTADFDFADIRNYPPADFGGIVIIALEPTDTRDVILALVDAFLSRRELVAALPGRLAIVERGRVRLRPPMGG